MVWIFLNTDFTKDRFQNLDYRIFGGAGLGYQFWDDDIKYLSFEAGPGYTYESFKTGEDRNYATARWAVKFHYWLLEDRLQFFHDHEGLISIEDVDDTLVRTHTGFKIPVYNGFDVLAQFDMTIKIGLLLAANKQITVISWVLATSFSLSLPLELKKPPFGGFFMGIEIFL